MLGAIIGDIVGSRFEFNNYRKKNFELFSPKSFFTDDTILTLAIGKALTETSKDACDKYYETLRENTLHYVRTVGRKYPDAEYGFRFSNWLYSDFPKPYYSFGNGAAMRVSAVAWGGNTLEEVKYMSRIVTEITHNHPEGIKGAEATAVAIFMARYGSTKRMIKTTIEKDYYALDFTIDEIRKPYKFNETCQNTVPQSIQAFLESSDFEDAIRTAVSVGGDSDTLAAITGSIAEAYYGIPMILKQKALTYLDQRLYEMYTECIKS